MPKQHQNFSWKIDSPLPKIQPHSLAKHRILKEYLLKYVETLTTRPQMDHLKLTLVDGFSGGGLFLDESTGEERVGSPLLMLQAMKEAAFLAQQRRSKKDFFLDVEYFFIEQNPDTFDFLKSQLNRSEFNPLLADKIFQLQGNFIDYIDQIVHQVKHRAWGERTIFVLDQFGYSGVPFSHLNSILASVKNAEVILTFAVDSLIDYMTTKETTQKILEKIGITLGADQIRSLQERANSRWLIQTRLIEEIKHKTGAQHFTPFFIRSNDAHRDYWLIHLSNHARARDVMVDLHWKENTSFIHYGKSGTGMLGYDPNEDPSITRQKMLPEFCFDQSALSSSHVNLIEELPEILSSHKEGITFKDFFSSITNETPATSKILRGVLSELAREKIIKIRDKSGLSKRSSVRSWSDVIYLSQQKRFIF